MPVQVKICGLSTPETLDAAIGGGVAHVGLMFYPPSPRHLEVAQAAALAARIPGHVGRVGVFVDPDDALVDAAIAAAGLDTLQVHRATPARLAALRARTGRRIWAAVAVRQRADLAAAADHAGAADLILYDAKTPDGALPGGMGVRFDWELLRGFRSPLPWALSGGLTAEVLPVAVAQSGARLVDVSSGVETAPGIKDVDKIAAFLKAAQQL
ncbi:phosphoribosylanthranilate isomerase [Sphingomonas sp.]|uniref:phosphoribosylanthranilate isomerase n=1 Tax=Sphingomonas sp. TaxID=28214 RepID=UPI001D4B1A72|nr:phosphoribosylanthranilate isomerase [Sphingomonas sp.]MBX9795571.1 phosphoribosylanthranilate isomerase [Sphingomonas sp.]